MNNYKIESICLEVKNIKIPDQKIRNNEGNAAASNINGNILYNNKDTKKLVLKVLTNSMKRAQKLEVILKKLLPKHFESQLKSLLK